MKCPKCQKGKAIKDVLFGVLPCESCQNRDRALADKVNKLPEFYTLTKQSRISKQRDEHAKDLLQPWVGNGKPNKEFVEAYPEQRDNYFTKEQLKKI